MAGALRKDPETVVMFTEQIKGGWFKILPMSEICVVL